MPVKNVRFKALEFIGYTQGTLQSSNFDHVDTVNDATVCPWSVFEVPLHTSIMDKIGPKPLSPSDGPVTGWPCRGHGANL